MIIRDQFKKLKVLKRALMLRRKASGMTPMERVIQRIATRVLKARFDEAMLDTLVMVSDRLVIGALLGISANKSLESRQVEQELSALGGSTGISWKPLVVNALRGFRQISETQMEDLIGKIYTNENQSAAYIAGKLVADPSISVKNQLAEKTRAIASVFRDKVENMAKDLVKSNSFKLDQATDSLYDEGGAPTPANVRYEMQALESFGDDSEDTDTFLQLVMFDGKRLAQNVRDYVLPLIKKDLISHFTSGKKEWSSGWAKDMMADPSSGMFANPPDWRNFRAAEYLREWVYTKVRSPKKFNAVADEKRGTYQARVEGKNLVISGLNLGSALGGKSISYLMTCSFGSATRGFGIAPREREQWKQARGEKMFQSRIHNVYVNGSDLVIVNWTKNYGDMPVDIVSDVHFLNMKREATFLNDRIKKYPNFLQRMFGILMDNPRAKKDLFAMMLTSQTFSRSLQAKLKKANEIKKNKHTNVPF